MSILSCETFLCDQTYVKIFRKKNSVEIDFEQALIISGNSTNKITIGDGSGFQAGQQILVQDNNAFGYNANVATVNTVYNASSGFRCLGYRLFMHNGYLKCVKKEVSDQYYYTITNVTTNISQQSFPSGDKRKIKARESFYHPAAMLDRFYTDECKNYILESVLELAKNRGVEVPKKFLGNADHFDRFKLSPRMPALDWLAYPFIRELDNVTVCKNMIHAERNFIAPNFEAKNFKQLVEHYFGTSTNKMLEEIWKIVAVGHDYKKTQFASAQLNSYPIAALAKMQSQEEILEQGDDYVIRVGDRHLQIMTFTLGAAIFKAMGFDYFYQAVPFLAFSYNRQFDPYDTTSGKIEEYLKRLLKFVTPKKLLSVLFQDGKKPDFHSLQDTFRMLGDYDSFEKIPPSLRLQYPNGLTVDFKFKTLKELHDKISTQYTIIKTELEKRPIPVTYLYSLLDGREKDGLRLVVPNNTSTLSVWGKLLNICIASYDNRAIRGETLLLGVEQDDRIKYCLEFRSIIVPKMEEVLGQVYKEGQLPEIANIERHTLPRLDRKHVGVTPPDTKEEDEFYHIPYIVQFRGERNGDPSKEDRAAVEHLLITWAQENIEVLKLIKGIFDNSSDWNFNGGNAALNEGHLQDALRYALQNQGQPEQLIVNQRDLAAIQNMMQPVIHDPNPGQIQVRIPGINVVANPNQPPGQIYLQRNGELPVIINNLEI